MSENVSEKENSLRDENNNSENNEENKEEIEIQYDEDGNPINQNEEEAIKEPQNPLKLDLIKKSLSKISKTYGKVKFIFFRWTILCLYSFKYHRKRIR